MNFKPLHLNLFRYRGEIKNREEWANRFDVLGDCLLVLFVVALMSVFIFSFLNL
jgi:preprotein translocase subunit SecE